MINFRDRVMGLQHGLEEKFKEIEEQKEKDKKKSGSNKEDNKKNQQTSPIITELMQVIDPDAALTAKPSLKTPIPLGHMMSLGYRQVRTAAKDIIETDTAPNFLILNYQFTRDWSRGSAWIWMTRVAMGRLTNEEEEEIDPYNNIGVFQARVYPELDLMPYIGVERELHSFVNLPATGGGLQPANTSLYMLTVGSYLGMTLFSQSMVFMPQYSYALGVAETDYATIRKASDVSATRLSFAIQFTNVVKKLNLELNYYQVALEAKGAFSVTSKSNGMGFNVFYNF